MFPILWQLAVSKFFRQAWVYQVHHLTCAEVPVAVINSQLEMDVGGL